MNRVMYWLFQCRHRRFSFPQTERKHGRSVTYICCLDCGKQFAYDPINWRRGPELPLRPQTPQLETEPWWKHVQGLDS